MELTARVGALTFQFVDARTDCFDPPIRFPLMLLEDGTLLEAMVSEGVVFLLVDQRIDRSDVARIEFWECRDVPEFEIGGLLAVCSARVPRRGPRITDSTVSRTGRDQPGPADH